MAFKTIVCGVTGSEASQKAAAEAARLAKKNQANLIYIYAVDTTFLEGMTVELTPDFAQKTLEHLGGHILDRAEEISKSEGVIPKKILKDGPILQVLRQVVSEEKADLLILGHEERSFFEKILLNGQVEDHIQELIKQTGIQVQLIR